MTKMSVREMLESGELEGELLRRIQNAENASERQDARNALKIAKAWRASLARAGGSSAGMRKGSITKAAALAVSLGDVECHELHSIASSYPQEIISGELEKEIQARLLKAISEDHAARQQTFAMALVKARAAARIVQTQ